MANSSPLRGLVWEWKQYLQERGHQTRASRNPDVLLSRNGRGLRYRWIFLYSPDPTRSLTAIEHEQIRRELRRSAKMGQQAYVVVKFDLPVCKVVAVPAARAAKTRRLRSDRGGIPWDW
ncbi:MAG: hypothetical protein V3W34_07785 [Phycisphaerae bacterium]